MHLNSFFTVFLGIVLLLGSTQLSISDSEVELFSESTVIAQLSDNTLCHLSNPVNVPYSVMEAQVKEICHDVDANSLIIYAEVTDDTGTINLEIPRILLDNKHQDCSDLSIFVLLDGEETSHQEVKTEKFRILTIPIHENITEIEITPGLSPIMESVPFMQCNKGLIQEFSPLQQANFGIPASELACKRGQELVFKSTNNSPACVKPETAQKLIERGWGKPILIIDSRLLDVRENPIVKLSMGSLVIIESDLIYRMNEQQDFSYVVTFYDENDNEFDKKWVTSSLDPNENYSPSFFWVPCRTNFVMMTIEIMDLELKNILSNSISISKEISGEILTEECGGRFG